MHPAREKLADPPHHTGDNAASNRRRRNDPRRARDHAPDRRRADPGHQRADRRVLGPAHRAPEDELRQVPQRAQERARAQTRLLRRRHGRRRHQVREVALERGQRRVALLDDGGVGGGGGGRGAGTS